MKTIDLDLAEELQSVCKEKNITMPESYFCYFESMQTHAVKIGIAKSKMFPIAPAYTLDELLEWLSTFKIAVSVDYEPISNTWSSWIDYNGRFDIIFDTNPANAACKLLIYLIKKGLI